MSFETEVGKDGRGRALRMEISFDRFATVAYRYSTVAGLLDGTNMYEPYLKSIGTISRGFGNERIVAPAIFDAVFTNTGGEVDWMVNLATFSSVRKARIRVHVVLWDPRDLSGNVSKMLGEFVFSVSSNPVRNASEVTAQMVDDVLGGLSGPVTLPTFGDWVSDPASTGENCPLKRDPFYYFNEAGKDEPIPLAFGGDWIQVINPGLARDPIGTVLELGANRGKHGLVVCISADESPTFTLDELRLVLTPDAPVSDDLESIYRAFENLGGSRPVAEQKVFSLPRKWPTATDQPGNETHSVPAPSGGYTLWEEAVGSVTLDGRTFSVLFIWVDLAVYLAWASATGAPFRNLNDTSPLFVGGVEVPPSSGRVYGGLDYGTWWTKGRPLSSLTVQSVTTTGIDGFDYTYTINDQHPADIIYDICANYIVGADPARIDSDSFDRVKASTPTAKAAGVIGNEALAKLRKQSFQSTMRGELTRLCQSADVDLFVNWDGKFALSSDLLDFNLVTGTGALFDVPETRIRNVSDRVPSSGERGFPFNRIFLEGGTACPPEKLDVPFGGPFNLDDYVTEYGAVVEVTLQQGWRPRLEQSLDPLLNRQIDNRVRPRLVFELDLEGILLDLGDIFVANWTRASIGGPYDGAYFQVIAASYSQEGDVVQIEALYKDDLRTVLPYLLDDEDLLLRVASGGGRYCTVEDGNLVITFNGGDLVADGVSRNDHLILKDATQGPAEFTRFRALKINEVTSGTTLEVSGDLDFDAPTPVNVDDWEIRRSYRTYPTAVSDVTNYPSGSTMYGKVSSTDDPPVYSDASNANRLTNG